MSPRTNRRLWYRIAIVVSLIAIGLVASILVAGQLGDDATDAGPAAGIRDSAAVDVDVNPGTATDEFVGARGDVTEDTCRRADAGWESAGDVTNPTDAPVSYRIYTSFVDPDGDTAALVQVDVVGVASGETRQWSATTNRDAEALRCVLRVERIAADADEAPTEDTSGDGENGDS